MKKKLIAVLLAVLTLTVAAVTVFAADTPVYTVDENGNITLDITLYLTGDVNKNTTIDMLDYLKIKRSLLSTSHAAYEALTAEEAEMAEVDGVPGISMLDYLKIKRSLLSSTHPAYEPLHDWD